MTNPIVIGIDAGGTMTDTILVDRATAISRSARRQRRPEMKQMGSWLRLKTRPRPGAFRWMNCSRGVNVVLYSGTGMLNTLLSRTGRRLGLITTKGPEDMILMGRGCRPGPIIPMRTACTPLPIIIPIRWCRESAPMA